MVATVFMLVGAMSFPVFIAVMQGRVSVLWQNQQLRGLFLCIAIVTVGLTMWQWHVNDLGFFESFRHALFNVVSVITTTGFASTDYSLWGGFPVAIFFFLTFVGGCTGSTTGGIKIFRFQVLYAITQAQLRRLVQPHGVFIPTYQGREITDPIALSVIAFLFMYGLFFAVLAMALGAFGLDFLTAISGAATALGNVGPGLGDVIGPVGNFASIPDGAKLLLSIGMLLGRLEFMALIIVLLPRFWRH
jgi:trk system potassium uptake protein TrkH